MEKTLTSSKLVYSQFEIPDTLVIGDKVNVPVKIINNLPESSTFELKIEEFRDGQLFKHMIRPDQVLAAKASMNQVYQIDTTTAALTNRNITLLVTLQQSGKVFDVLQKSTNLVLDGFNDQTTISNIFEVRPACTSPGCVDAPIPPLTETFTFPDTMLGKPLG